MNKKILKGIALLFFVIFIAQDQVHAKNTTNTSSNIFEIKQPDFKKSPYTGMTRTHWIEAAEYMLNGAFSYINTLDDPMKFPKQFDKTYPKNERQIPVEKLEGLCRTLFVAAPLLKEKPNMVLNNIKVADYYRHQILQLINPESPSFIKHRTGGASQTLVEFGALAISLSVASDILWEPLTKEQKDELAATMLSYGEGPTIDSNWRFFNIFVLSFFKDKGYTIKESVLIENLEKALAFYRGYGWYNDAPAYDYYSMWAFQMYGPLWSQLYGKKYYPEYAQKFMSNLNDMVDNYPYMFNREGKMNMWGRSIPYRFGTVAPFPLLTFTNNTNINFGWLRHIASSTLLQFVQNPAFLEDKVPTLGFYGPFEPAVQIYSCRGSVYWSGKAFMTALLLPEDNVFWSQKENNDPWEKELKKDNVYNKFQENSNLLITNYPNSGASEMRSWCHEKVANDWQKFRSGENYNKLAYNTEFPWMADGKNGEISMNYAIKNKDNQWEVLRLYTFKKFENGIYYRDAVMESNENIKFKLADITLPDGILRVDKVSVPATTEIRLGHYSLPEIKKSVEEKVIKDKGQNIYTISNGEFQLAMYSLAGWNNMEFVRAQDLHPVSKNCTVIDAIDTVSGSKIYVTLQLWKKGNKGLSKKELNPIKAITVFDDENTVEIVLQNGDKKVVDLR